MSRASELADWCDEHSSGDYRISAEAATELRRLDRVNAELVEAYEAQKNEWLAWDAKRAALERDATRYRLLRIEACKPQARITVGIWGVDGNSHAGTDARIPEVIDQVVDALTSATKETKE